MMSRGALICLCLALNLFEKSSLGHRMGNDTTTASVGEYSSMLSVEDSTLSTTDTNITFLCDAGLTSNNTVIPGTPRPSLRRSGPLAPSVIIEIFYVFGATVTITGCVGSALVILLLARGTLKSSASVYMIALAISDFLYLVLTLPNLMNLMISDDLRASTTWKMIYSYYDVYVAESVYIIQSWGIWVTICLTIERYIAVCYPMKLQILAKESRAKIIVISIFAVMTAFNVSRFFRRTVSLRFNIATNQTLYIKVVTPLGQNVTYTAVLYWSYVVISALIPFPILATFNGIIILNLRKLSQQRKFLTGLRTDTSRMGFFKARDNQITRILIGVVIAFLLCNIVTAVRHVHVALAGPDIYRGNFLTIYVWVGGILALFNPTANFILYFCCSKSMRKALIDMVTGRCHGKCHDKTVMTHQTGITPTTDSPAICT